MGSTSDPGSAHALLLARVQDCAKLCERRNAPCFLGFLDEGEQQIIRQTLGTQTFPTWTFCGGHDGAERCMIGFFPTYMEPEPTAFPMTPYAFHYRPEKALTHRDFLGTLLSTGLRREMIGDILCGSGLTVVFLRDEIGSYVTDQIVKIGGEGVRIEAGYTGELPIAHTFSEIRDTVASPRLDAVVKALIRCSREQAARLIVSGMVEVNHLPVETVSAQIAPASVISVRGSGRYIIDEIGPETRKGRVNLLARKYL